MSHEGTELSKAKVVSIGFVENLLRCIEGVHDQAVAGWHKANMLQTWKSDPGILDVIARRIEHRRLEH